MARPFQFSLRSLFVAVFIVSLLCLGLRALGVGEYVGLWCILLMGFAYGCRVKIYSTQRPDWLGITIGGLWGALISFLGVFYAYIMLM